MLDAVLAWLRQPQVLVAALAVLAGLLFAAGYMVLRRRPSGRAWAIVLAVGAVLVLALGQAFRPQGGGVSVPQRMLWTLIAAMGVSLAALAAQRTILGRVTTLETRHKVRRAVFWAGACVFLGLAAIIWAPQVGNLGVFLGVLGAGLALSLQETLLCIAGWVLILIKRPFDIGDRIETDGRIGDVIDVGVFQTSLLEVGNWVDADQSTGRLAVMPNSMVFRQVVYNYTKGFPFVWNEFDTVVTFESDWTAAKGIMLAQAEEEAERIEAEVSSQIQAMQSRYAIHYDQLRPIVYTSIADHGVRLTLRYLSPARQRRDTMHRISEAVLHAFLDHPRIDFAYPTTRFYRNPQEGKAALGGARRSQNGPGAGG